MNGDYAANQIDRVLADGPNGDTQKFLVKITGVFGVSTKWLSITREQAQAIRDILAGTK